MLTMQPGQAASGERNGSAQLSLTHTCTVLKLHLFDRVMAGEKIDMSKSVFADPL